MTNNDDRHPISDNDIWVMLIRRTSAQRVTCVGPYFGKGGLVRAKQDMERWVQDPEVRAIICRMMHPEHYEFAFDEGIDEPFGYSANMVHKPNKQGHMPFLLENEE